jgi:hypothetical protein
MRCAFKYRYLTKAKTVMTINPESHLARKKFTITTKGAGYKLYTNNVISAVTVTDPQFLTAKEGLATLRREADASAKPIWDVYYHGGLALGDVAGLGRGALHLGSEKGIHLHDLSLLGKMPNRWDGEATSDTVLAAINWYQDPKSNFPPRPGKYLRFWPRHWYDADWNQLPKGVPDPGRSTGGRNLAFEIYVPPKNPDDNYRISLVRHKNEPMPREFDEISKAIEAAVFTLFRDQNRRAEHTVALAKWQRGGFPGVTEHRLNERLVSYSRPTGLLSPGKFSDLNGFIREWFKSPLTLEAVACLTNFG